MQTIATNQLVLRPLTPSDKEMFCQLYTNSNTMAYIAPAYSQEKASNSFNSASNFNNNNTRIVKTWAIELNNSNSKQKSPSKTIGIVMLYDEWFKIRLSTIEVGILLLPGATGQSYGQEALSGLLTYCFNDLSLNQVNIRFHPDNQAMRSVSKKLGFLPPNSIKPVDEVNKTHSVNDTINIDHSSNYFNVNERESGSDEKKSNMEEQMWLHCLPSQHW